MTNQLNRVHAHVNEYGGSQAVKVHDIVRINPPEFLELQANEDTHNFFDEIKKIFEVMQVTWNGRFQLASYQFNDFAHIWYIQLKDTTPITWVCISKTFLDRFFLIEFREAKAQEFISLKKGNMTVQEYGLEFNHLYRYSPHMVADSRAQMKKFLYWSVKFGENLVQKFCFTGRYEHH